MRRNVIAIFIALLTATLMFAAVEKFTFENQSFSDGQEGTVRASVKQTQKSLVIVCDYFTAEDKSLGQFQANEGPTDEAGVRQFCLDHFNERQPGSSKQ